MANESITQATQAIQQINVADMMSSMAIAIANAQEKLDANSIASLNKLVETKIGDKSLLELGFHPAFYQFKFADLSASLNLSFKYHDYQSLGIEASIEYDRFKDFDKEKLKEINESQLSAKRKEFKSSKDVVINIERDKALIVNESTLQIQNKDKSISKIKQLEADLRADADIERVESKILESEDKVTEYKDNGAIVTNSNGFVTIHKEVAGKEGILEIKEYDESTTTSIEIDDTSGSEEQFELGNSLVATITNASTVLDDGDSDTEEQAILFTNEGYSTDGTTFDPIELHFGFDQRYVDFSYAEGIVNNGANPDDELHFRILAYILRNSDATLSITGYTDAVGKVNTNEELGTARAQFAKGVLVSLGADADKISVHSVGETTVPESDKGEKDKATNAKYRKVLLKLNTSAEGYLYIKGEKIVIDITTTNPTTSDIIWQSESTTTPTVIEFKYGDTTLYLDPATSIVYESNKSTVNNSFNVKVEGDIHYLLHKDKDLQITVYSNTKEDIEIKENYSLDKDKRMQKDKIFVSEAINEQSLLKRATTKKDGTEYLSINAKADFRQTKQFDLDVTGNASINARLEAIPAPDTFKEYIDSIINKEQ